MANSLIDFGVVQPEASGAFLRGLQQSQALAQQQADQQRQNALIDLQLRAAQRGEEEALAEREAYRRAGGMAQVPQELRAAGLGKQAMAAEEFARKRQTETLQRRKLEDEIGQMLIRRVYTEGTRQSVNDAIAEADALGLPTGPIKTLFDRTPDSEIARVAFTLAEGPKALEQTTTTLPGGGAIVGPRFVLPSAQAPAAPMAAQAMPAGIPGQTPPTRAAGTNALALPAPGGGQYYKPEMTPQQLAAEARAQQGLALEQRRVELAEKEQARKEAGLAEPLPTKELQRREATYPQAKGAIEGFEAKSESFINDLKTLRDHPGLGEITGFVAGNVPTALSGNGRAAIALYNKITAKGGFQELQDLRAASKTGGALGSISNQEGKQLIASFAAIDRRQNAEDVRNALNLAISDVEGSRARMRQVFDDTYEYRAGKEPSAATPAKSAAPAATPAKSAAPKRREIAPGVFVTERP